jgi:hypothetical protein
VESVVSDFDLQRIGRQQAAGREEEASVLDQTDLEVSPLHGHPVDRQAHLKLEAGLHDQATAAARGSWGAAMEESRTAPSSCSKRTPSLVDATAELVHHLPLVLAVQALERSLARSER